MDREGKKNGEQERKYIEKIMRINFQYSPPELCRESQNFPTDEKYFVATEKNTLLDPRPTAACLLAYSD